MKYLAFYDVNGRESEKRNTVPAATNKIQYICECLEKNKVRCDIISASYTYGKNNVSARKEKISDYITLDIPFSIGRKNKLLSILNYWQMKASVFFRLLKIKKSETLIVYHSLFYMNMVYLLKKIKKFRLIIEAEEIYGDVIGKKSISNEEIKYFKSADAYIFPTELLNEKVNVNKKPNVIIYGTYKVEEDRNCKFNDGKIHVVYAGTFDPRKGGVQATISAVPHLNSSYHVHIIGFGCDADKKMVLDEIARISKTCQCIVTYDGLLSGEDYIRFLQSCHIGLSTQNPDAEYNDTSFPSKILSYLANGLNVVTVKINVIEQSAISSMLYYYEGKSGENIANVIKSIDINRTYDSRKIVKDLDAEFISNIKQLVEEKNE